MFLVIPIFKLIFIKMVFLVDTEVKVFKGSIYPVSFYKLNAKVLAPFKDKLLVFIQFRIYS
ncbi:hypothetical protein [Richelia intracellularis]|uniref:hypothetical protein n=1 Tax=Richelia intracellularis TaxID=1164990 RepID=UPI0038B52BD8